ncbi:TetR/AcrR family transcriptional regulator [Rhodobacteraceae bacterium]|nr:TetR/AcrR family transcriptional regulator [Paracoccaceae bacterium]
MARDTEKRRAELRAKLLEIAEIEVREKGVQSLRARALAEQAGCAVGAIYNVFDDLTGLILALNGRTFQRLGASVSEEVDQSGGAPVDKLIIMGHAYLRFATDNPNLWRALFDVEMTADGIVPVWYLEELGRLFAIIAAPLAQMHPKAEPAELDLMTRTLFSSVHGIVLLGLERRISGVPTERIKEMITFLLTRFSEGP